MQAMTTPSSALMQALEASATRVAKNFPALTSPAYQRPRISEAQALQAAKHLQEDLSCVPFYAKRAQQCLEKTGSETGYWLDLQGSEATLQRRPLDSSKAQKA
jgi:hypothetical protein